MMRDRLLEQTQLFISQGNLDAAIEQLRELLSYDPDDATAHALLAAVLLEKLRVYAARYEVDLALRLAPTNAYAMRVKARVAFLSQHHQEALQLCDDSLRIDPNDAEAHLIKAMVYAHYSDNKNYLQSIQHAAALAPEDEDVLVQFGRYYLSVGDPNNAEAYLRDALSKNAQNESANVLMGEVMLHKGDVAGAEYQAKFALSQNPSSESALRLFTALKVRKNIFLGLWWRWNAKLASLGNLQSTIIVIALFLFFSFLSLLLNDFGYRTLSNVTMYFWLALVAYTWVAIPIFYRMLKKELQQFRFDPDF